MKEMFNNHNNNNNNIILKTITSNEIKNKKHKENIII